MSAETTELAETPPSQAEPDLGIADDDPFGRPVPQTAEPEKPPNPPD